MPAPLLFTDAWVHSMTHLKNHRISDYASINNQPNNR